LPTVRFSSPLRGTCSRLKKTARTSGAIPLRKPGPAGWQRIGPTIEAVERFMPRPSSPHPPARRF
jgi:hypothetical protein